MTTLLVAGSRRCSRRCYDAEGPVCDCPACGGRLHGVGRVPLAAGRAVEGGRALVDAAAYHQSLAAAFQRREKVAEQPESDFEPEELTSARLDHSPDCAVMTWASGPDPLGENLHRAPACDCGAVAPAEESSDG